MLAELLEADPYQAMRKDFKTEAANYGVARLRQGVTTFTTSFTSSLASTAFKNDKLDEQEQHNKANAKAKAEKTALENSQLSGRVDATKFAKYTAKHGGNKDIDALYERAVEDPARQHRRRRPDPRRKRAHHGTARLRHEVHGEQQRERCVGPGTNRL